MLLTLARNCSYQVPLICMRLFWLCFILFHLILFTSSQHVIVLLNSHILRLNSIHPRKHIRSWFSHRFIVTGQGRCTSFKSISKIPPKSHNPMLQCCPFCSEQQSLSDDERNDTIEKRFSTCCWPHDGEIHHVFVSHIEELRLIWKNFRFRFEHCHRNMFSLLPIQRMHILWLNWSSIMKSKVGFFSTLFFLSSIFLFKVLYLIFHDL